jgi:hypothetical protein
MAFVIFLVFDTDRMRRLIILVEEDMGENDE